MIFNSIRWRLQAWHGLILVLVLTGFGVTAYQVARNNQLRRVDQELGQRLGALFRPHPGERPQMSPKGPPPGPPADEHRGDHHFDPGDFLTRLREAIQHTGALDPTQTNTFYYLAWESNGTVVARSPVAPQEVPVPRCVSPAGPHLPPTGLTTGRSPFPQSGPSMPVEARTRGELRELFLFLPHSECVLVGRSLAPDLAAMRRLALWLVTAGAGVLLLGLAGGWWLAARAIRPIDDISRTATKIAAGDLSQRINIADTESELGRLGSVLNSTFARLEAAFAHQARFTADASHELRTPISVIVTQTQTTLSRERSGAEYREALAACQRAAKRMRTLTESLLQLARLDAGQEPLQQQQFDLIKTVQESLELIRPLAAERGLELQAELGPVNCLGDAGRIGQVVTNLLTNAINFNREHGQIQVRTGRQNGVGVLEVSDTGEGIPAKDLPNIFQRFYRVDQSRSRTHGHNGLGLAICKAILDAQGGSIEVSSQPSKGSTFTVKLPAC